MVSTFHLVSSFAHASTVTRPADQCGDRRIWQQIIHRDDLEVLTESDKALAAVRGFWIPEFAFWVEAGNRESKIQV